MCDAYLELALGAIALRYPPVQEPLARASTLNIKSSFENQDVILRIEKILAEIEKQGLIGPKNLRTAFSELNRMFLVSMWGILQDTQTFPSISTQPVIQFFRHVRNACAHNGRFNFTSVQHKAKWRDKEITPSQSGQELFPKFLMDGDVLLLVLDVNAHFYAPVSVDGHKTA